MDVLLLRLQAHIMSFGGTALDDYGSSDRFPCRSMLTGLIANALGASFTDPGYPDFMGDLQRRLRYAVRCDREGVLEEDFQTVDVTQGHLQGALLTSYGWTEARGSSPYRTIVRHQEYLAGASYLVAVAFEKDSSPSPDEIEQALKQPARMLFFGRKSCLPSQPIFHRRVEATTLVEALQRVPAPAALLKARWPVEEASGGRIISVTEDRDWQNNIHVGERRMREGKLAFKEVT